MILLTIVESQEKYLTQHSAGPNNAITMLEKVVAQGPY